MVNAALSSVPSIKSSTTRKFSPVEIADHRVLGLCFKCDEMFTPDHMEECEQLFTIELLDEDDANPIDDTSIFTRSRGSLNIKDQAGRSAHKEVGPNK
jgi:hypothetical protein